MLELVWGHFCTRFDSKGVLNADGQEWQEQRRFTLRHLRDFGFGKNRMESLIMNEVTEFISGVKTLEMTPVSMKHKFEMSVLNSLWTITTGKRIGPEDTRSLEMFKKIDQLVCVLSLA